MGMCFSVRENPKSYRITLAAPPHSPGYTASGLPHSLSQLSADSPVILRLQLPAAYLSPGSANQAAVLFPVRNRAAVCRLVRHMKGWRYHNARIWTSKSALGFQLEGEQQEMQATQPMRGLRQENNGSDDNPPATATVLHEGIIAAF
jgi:hypothetical protein